MANEVAKEMQIDTKKEPSSADSITDSKIFDFSHIDKLQENNDFASYFALNRITKKIDDSQKSFVGNQPDYLRNKYQKYKNLRKYLVIIYITMSIFQRPVWCNFYEYEEFCQIKIGQLQKIQTTIPFYFPITLYYIIEILLVLTLAIFKIIKYYTQQPDKYTKLIVFALLIVSIIITINDIIVIILDNDYNFNVSSLLKPFFLILYSHLLQVTLHHYVTIIYRGKEIYYLMLFSLLFFGGLGEALFKDLDFVKDDESRCNITATPFTQQIYCTFLVLFQLQTTVNSPDMYLDYYNYNKAYVAYFILFQFINTLLIINLIVAFFYSAYKNVIEESTRRLLQTHSVKLAKYTAKYLRKRAQSEVRSFSRDVEDLQGLWVEVYKILDHWLYETIMEFIHLVVFVLIFFDPRDKLIQIHNFVLNFVILIEILLLSYMMGWRKLKKSKENLFNFTITSLILILLCYLMFSTQHHWMQTMMLCLMSLRLLRGCRWLLQSKNFTYLIIQMVSILQYIIQLFGMLFILFMIFSAIGQLFFGGKLIYLSDGINELYDLISFNDFLSGLCTCWFLMIINNWNVMSFYYAEVFQTDLVYIFFISFYVIVVLLTLNVTMALLIDYLVTRWQKQKSLNKNLVEPFNTTQN